MKPADGGGAGKAAESRPRGRGRLDVALRDALLRRASRLTRPAGQLTFNADRAVRDKLRALLEGLRRAAQVYQVEMTQRWGSHGNTTR